MITASTPALSSILKYSSNAGKSLLNANTLAATYIFLPLSCVYSTASFSCSLSKFFALARRLKQLPPIYTASAPKCKAVLSLSISPAGASNSTLSIFILCKDLKSDYFLNLSFCFYGFPVGCAVPQAFYRTDCFSDYFFITTAMPLPSS